MLFCPTYFTEKVTNITIDFLKSENINGIIIDVDDTLVAHKTKDPEKSIVKWIDLIKENDIKIIILSNNFKNRVEIFAKKISLPYIYLGMKPLPSGLKKAIKLINTPIQNTLLVGDQIFTDILAANLLELKSLLVNPLEEKNSGIFLRFKRFLEKHIKKNLISNKSIHI